MTCSKCETPLTAGNRYSQSEFCLSCVGAPVTAVTAKSGTAPIEEATIAQRLPARALDDSDEATAARIVAMANGGSLPSPLAAGDDTEAAFVRRMVDLDTHNLADRQAVRARMVP